MELRAHGVVVVPGHGTYLAGLGGLVTAWCKGTYSVSLYVLALIGESRCMYLRFCQFHIRMVSALY
jgi:hypothetical protein